MSKTKAFVLVTLIVLAISLLIFSGVMMAMKWDFTRFSFSKFETNEHTVDAPFSDIAVIGDAARITLAPADGGEVKVVCRERERARHTVSVEDGCLLIELDDQREWYDHIDFFGSAEITVYLPAGGYGDLTIKRKTGDVKIPQGFTFGSVDIEGSTGETSFSAVSNGALHIKASTGRIRLFEASAASIELRTSTGDITLISTVSHGDLSLFVTTGKVWVDGTRCAGDATVTASTGDLYFMGFAARSLTTSGDTGDIELRESGIEGAVTILRSTGDVELCGVSCSSLKLKTSTGVHRLTSVNASGDISTTVSSGRSYLERVRCQGLESSGSSGRVHLSDVVAEGVISLARVSGAIEFDGCDAAEIVVETSSGDVCGSLLSEKIFIVRSSSGKIRVPETTEGGACRVKTASGDIILTVE